MNEKHHGANYTIAKAEADKVDEMIITALQEGRSFRVEAGAGSGKTYSLKRVIEWIEINKRKEYNRNKQNVICITYTNSAVDVITERLSSDSFIAPSTIHSFAWNAIKQYQSTLIKYIEENNEFQKDETNYIKVTEIKYTLGHRYKENGVQFLYHNDVLKLFEMLLGNIKFRRVFADKFPLILIDEYQDSNKLIIDRFVNHFIGEREGPQFGFFGDAWQTIYQLNNACGSIENSNLKVIKKGSNFRSAPKIVSFLNNIRSELPQQSAIDDFEGDVAVVTCEDFLGMRRTDKNFKGDLPATELRTRLENLIAYIKKSVPAKESIKTLMITHKVLAAQQGYDELLDILGDGLRDKEDPFLLFFMDTVEPIYKALSTQNMQLLFDALYVKRYPTSKKSEKVKWKELKHNLEQVREKKSIDVLRTVIDSGLIPIPPQVEAYYQSYSTAPESPYSNNITILKFLELEYKQFLAAINFLQPEAEFSTEHGVKGEEYDNVIFVISKGWNQYQFEEYAPMITGSVPVPGGKEASFERNRNLFYVCCSRAKKRLIFFVTVKIEQNFRAFLYNLVGENNIYTYSGYLNK